MQVSVPRQTQPGETRVPLVPAAVKRLAQQGATVCVERGAGIAAGFADQAYEDAGARLVDSGDALAGLWGNGDVVITLGPPAPEQVDALRQGAVLIGLLEPFYQQPLIEQLAQRQITAFSMELIPRTSRAQAMDVLSSQANIAGFKAVLLAANHCPKVFPMMMTAAGTLAPAKVFVLGVGVAGLQAIATAKRLGAVVEAYDVRAATKEQVLSLGARFVELPTAAQDDKATGGYAKEQSEEERQQQAQAMARHLTAADVVISTAAVFGRTPPMLIPGEVVRQMRPGTVILDMAADVRSERGNCELTRPGQTWITDEGVCVIGTLNLPALVPSHASQAYASNIANFLLEGRKDLSTWAVNLDDDIQQGACITHAGSVIHPLLLERYASNP